LGAAWAEFFILILLATYATPTAAALSLKAFKMVIGHVCGVHHPIPTLLVNG
jgi:hypothetical protein